MPSPGHTQIGPFLIGPVVARGQYATLYEVRHTHPDLCDRPWVMKVLDEPSSARHFLRHARVSASLRHSNIPAVSQVGDDAGRYYLTRDFVAGTDLTQTLREGPRPLPQVVRVVADVAAALDHAHARGVVHGDLHPRHVLLGDDGAVWVIGFGEYPPPGLAATGNPLHLAPEQFGVGPVTPAADVYALAEVAAWLLTGRHPFDGLPLVEMIDAKRAGRPPRPVRVDRPDVPAAAADVLHRALAHDPLARHPGAGAFAAALAAAGRPAARRRRWFFV